MGKKNKKRDRPSNDTDSQSQLKVEVDEFEQADDLFDPTNEYLDGDKLNATFKLEAIQDGDSYLLKELIKNLLVDTAYNSMDLCNIIIEERGNIGSVIMVEGQEDIYGLMSIIDVKKYKTRPSIQSILKYVKSKVSGSSQYDEWKRILEDEKETLGVVISERIVNVPNQLAPHLNLITFDEAGKLESKFTHYLVITDSFKEVNPEEAISIKKSKTTSSSSNLDLAPHFPKAEDEIFKEVANLFHSVRVMRNNEPNRWTFRMLSQQSRVFMMIPGDQMPSVISKLKKLANTKW